MNASTVLSKCCFCRAPFTPVELESHQYHCPANTQECEECRQEIPFAKYSDHIQVCFARTRKASSSARFPSASPVPSSVTKSQSNGSPFLLLPSSRPMDALTKTMCDASATTSSSILDQMLSKATGGSHPPQKTASKKKGEEEHRSRSAVSGAVDGAAPHSSPSFAQDPSASPFAAVNSSTAIASTAALGLQDTGTTCIFCNKVIPSGVSGVEHQCPESQQECLYCGEVVHARMSDIHHSQCLRQHLRKHPKYRAEDEEEMIKRHLQYEQQGRDQREKMMQTPHSSQEEGPAPQHLGAQQHSALHSYYSHVLGAVLPPPSSSSDQRQESKHSGMRTANYSSTLQELLTEYAPLEEETSVVKTSEPREAERERREEAAAQPSEEEINQILYGGSLIPKEQRDHLRLCVLCQKVIRKADQMVHLETCPANTMSCEFCRAGVAVSQYDQHLRQCPKNCRDCYICSRKFHIDQLPSHLMECGREGKVITMFHGTTLENSRMILRHGFQPSTKGLLGKGVYLSRDVGKASNYGDVIVEAKVNIGKVAVINRKGHHMQKCWNAHGFDCAWVPANSKVGVSELEEHCVYDPRRVVPVRATSALQQPK